MTATTHAHKYAHVTLTLQIKDNADYAEAIQDLIDALDSSDHWKTGDPGVRVDAYQAESLGQRFRGTSGAFTLPEHAQLVRSSDRTRLELLLDGVPFPYAVARDSVYATPTVGRGPDTVSLDLIVDRVTITDTPKEHTP